MVLSSLKLRSRVGHIESSANDNFTYRTSLMDVDRSCRVKMETLESIYLVQSFKDWCTVEDVYRELEYVAASPFESGRRGVSMRMLRYKRQGLLIRRKIGSRLTEYKLSQKGEDRLIYFWKKFNLLDPPLGWQFMGEEGRLGKELADERNLLYKEILSNQIERLKKNRQLRTPKARIVIRFESTLKEIEERKNRMKAYPRKI
jgi:hypothetical protein